MSGQLSLFQAAVEVHVGLPCAFGVYHHEVDHCAACEAEVERGCAEFRAAVSAGIYDSEGYTPAERREQVRRRASKAIA